jgi:hypothetical protein
MRSTVDVGGSLATWRRPIAVTRTHTPSIRVEICACGPSMSEPLPNAYSTAVITQPPPASKHQNPTKSAVLLPSYLHPQSSRIPLSISRTPTASASSRSGAAFNWSEEPLIKLTNLSADDREVGRQLDPRARGWQARWRRGLMFFIRSVGSPQPPAEWLELICSECSDNEYRRANAAMTAMASWLGRLAGAGRGVQPSPRSTSVRRAYDRRKYGPAKSAPPARSSLVPLFLVNRCVAPKSDMLPAPTGPSFAPSCCPCLLCRSYRSNLTPRTLPGHRCPALRLASRKMVPPTQR